jgi:DNA-3-methyladenine glycosylase
MKERFADFSAQYQQELDGNPAIGTLLELAADHPRVTLLYGARDPEVNHARVLLEFIRRHASR